MHPTCHPEACPFFARKDLSRCVLSLISGVVAAAAAAAAELVQMDGEDHHVHLLVKYPPKLAVSHLVNSLKGVSSRMLRQERPDLAARYWKGVLWSPSYFAARSGGAPINILKDYFRQQKTPL